jgi:hypothetical protein
VLFKTSFADQRFVLGTIAEHAGSMPFVPMTSIHLFHRLVLDRRRDGRVSRRAAALADWCIALIERHELPISVLGPAPCPLVRIKDRWRWHVLLKGPSEALGRVVRYAAKKPWVAGIEKNKAGVWEALFEGDCGRPYKYTIKMLGRQAGDVVLFQGSADLGEKDGGVYDWIGRASDKEFVGFFTSGYYTGVFNLARQK